MTSFPFLKIARERNASYKEVLLIAEAIEVNLMRRPSLVSRDQLDLERAIYLAVLAERQRRAKVIHDALHTGDAP